MNNAQIGVHFYGCVSQETAYSASFLGQIWEEGVTGVRLLRIEEFGWKSYSPGNPEHKFSILDLQRAIYTINGEMRRRMQLGWGLGRCVLFIKNRFLTQLNGCVKITNEGCERLQHYILQAWQNFTIACEHWRGQCSENGQCKKPVDACRELELPDMRSDRLMMSGEHQDKYRFRIIRSIPRNTTVDQLFPLAFDEKVSVEAREPSCRDETLSSTVLAMPWTIFRHSNPQGTTVRIGYVSNREVDNIPSKQSPIGNVEIFGEKSFHKSYDIFPGVIEETRVTEIGNLILELDIPSLKQLQLPERTLHLSELKGEMIQKALLSEDLQVQSKGIKWQQEEAKRKALEPEEEKTKRQEEEKVKQQNNNRSQRCVIL